VSNATCVPGCFAEQDLAGELRLRGGYLHTALTGTNGSQALAIIDVASDVEAPSEAVEAFQPCSSGDARGFAELGAFAFVGCRDVPEVHAFQVTFVLDPVADLDGVDLDDGAAGMQLLEAVRALAVTRVLSGAATRSALVVLDATGALGAFDLGDYDGGLAPPPLAAPLPDLGFTWGARLVVQGDRLYALGGTGTCDPFGAAACAVDGDNLLQVIDVDDLTIIATHDLGTGEARQTLTAYPDLLVVGRATLDHRYDLRDRDGTLRSVAAPNALTLDAAVVGGHLFSAALTVFALE
jgi:hypothetical protein